MNLAGFDEDDGGPRSARPHPMPLSCPARQTDPLWIAPCRPWTGPPSVGYTVPSTVDPGSSPGDLDFATSSSRKRTNMHRDATRLALAAVVALASGAFVPPACRAEDKPRTIPDLKVETFTLPNGLNVILHEDHTTPFVGVNLWYKVGSKDEKPGRTGFAHLFEHLMFQGSKHHDSEYFGPLEKLGAQINGSTSTDRTNYYEALPTNGLETALWLEADRMGFLLPALTQAKLDNQRDVVKNERRQRVDNVALRPGRRAARRVPLSVRPPLPPLGHRLDGRPLGRQPRRRLGLLPDLLQPEQRQPHPRRRHQPGRGPASSSRSTSARSPEAPRSPSSRPRCRS